MIGGLCIFLMGMKYMSEGMQAIAGTKLRKMISAVTDRRIKACTTGAAITEATTRDADPEPPSLTESEATGPEEGEGLELVGVGEPVEQGDGGDREPVQAQEALSGDPPIMSLPTFTG